MTQHTSIYQTHLSAAEDDAQEQEDVIKLVGVVEESIAQIAKFTSLPVQEVLHIIEEVDVARLTHATKEAIKKISNATDLCRADIVSIFTEDKKATVDRVVDRLREESRLHRATF